LSNDLLGKTKGRDPGQVVWWLGAVQAQDRPAAKWSTGLRTHEATDTDVETAFPQDAVLFGRHSRCGRWCLEKSNFRDVEAIPHGGARPHDQSVERMAEACGVERILPCEVAEWTRR
jgi:hypothetical protein